MPSALAALGVDALRRMRRKGVSVMLRVLVCGSRSLRVSALTVAEVVSLARLHGQVGLLVSGGAPGVDRVVPEVAEMMGCPSVVVRPDYARYGGRAPLVRDREMVGMVDVVIALWDGRSRGTAYTVACARRAGVPFFLFRCG